MQTRSRRGNNPQFLQRYDIVAAQNSRKRKAADSPTFTDSDDARGTPQQQPRQPPHSNSNSQLQSRLTRSTASRQLQSDFDGRPGKQQQRRQQAEEKEQDNVIVLDDEVDDEQTTEKLQHQEDQDEDEDDIPLQHKRRRAGSGTHLDSSNTALVAVAPRRLSARADTSDAGAGSHRLPPRRPLFATIREPIASFSRTISNTIGSFFSGSPFSSTATHYTRQQKHNTRSTTHTLSDGRWRHATNDAYEAKDNNDDDDIDRTFHTHTSSHSASHPFHDTTPYLTYPPHTNRQSVTITHADLHRLLPNEFLNDTLIEFYLLYIRDRVVPPAMRGRFHFFNSFLFTRLSEYGGSEGVREVYGSVRKWTKGVNLFEKDFIVMPINDADRHHWSLVIIAYPGRAMRPKGTFEISAAVTADKAKQKAEQQQQAGGGMKRADNRKAAGGGGGGGGGGSGGGAAGDPKRTKVTFSSPAKAALSSNARQTRNGKPQQSQSSIPALFASQSAHPPSSLLALSARPLTVPKPHTKPNRSLRQRTHGEQMALLAVQQQQQPSRRATRSSVNDSPLSPENETTRRLTESKGNIRAAMNRSPYSKQQQSSGEYEQRKKDEEWQRALAVPDEQPIAVYDTQPLPLDDEEMLTEEKTASSSSPAAAAPPAGDGALPPHYYADVQFEEEAVDKDGDDPLTKRVEQVESSNKSSSAEQKESEAAADQMADMEEQDQKEPAQQEAADAGDGDVDIAIETDADEPVADVPILPRIADSVPPTLPLSIQPTVPTTTSTTNSASTAQLRTDEAGCMPCILHLDSLPIPPSQTRKIASILREYLQCEWEHQQSLRGITPPPNTPPTPPPPPTHPSVTHYTVPLASPRTFSQATFPERDVLVPVQPNDYDCGVYILHFAELFCREPWGDLRRLDKEGWFSSRMEKEGDKRVRMRALVDELKHEEEFERVMEESKRQMERELEVKRRGKQQQPQPAGQTADMDDNSSSSSSSSTSHKGVYVPDSDEEEDEQGEHKQEKVVKVDKRRASSGQRGLAGEDIEGAIEGVPIAITNRSTSFVPSSQPTQDDEYEFP